MNNPSANFSFELDPEAILKSNFGFQSNCFETMLSGPSVYFEYISLGSEVKVLD